MKKLNPTEADKKIFQCINERKNFALVAGAGAGKSTSLVESLKYIRQNYGQDLRRNGQKIACITYTNRAVRVIEDRLDFDDLFEVSTIHTFLWQLIRGFQHDIREVLEKERIPALIERAKKRPTDRIDELNQQRDLLFNITQFAYNDTKSADYSKGELSHDDVLEIASYFLKSDKPVFRTIIGHRFPYIFIDEAQDTHPRVIQGLNSTSQNQSPPLIGYFGDPWQRIYSTTDENSSFPPTEEEGFKLIEKTENYRCPKSVIRLLNVFRESPKQYAAGKNKNVEGSVIFRLVEAETPSGDRKSYTEEQLERAEAQMNNALQAWEWSSRDDVIKLFLVRQMIARRLGFHDLHNLFTGEYASNRAQESYENGTHKLLEPFIQVIWPLVEAHKAKDERRIIEILTQYSPRFSPNDARPGQTLKDVIQHSRQITGELRKRWASHTTGDILKFSVDKGVLSPSEFLKSHLDRSSRTEKYDPKKHALEKGDWLADSFFEMSPTPIEGYFESLQDWSTYSTQHGVKGEEYPKVLVVYDDIEAKWNHYNFGRILTPKLTKEPTHGQRDRGTKLAYVAFSRATEDLRVLFFTDDPQKAKNELVERGLVKEEQIEIAPPL